jgi:hypothetical protein
MISVQAGRDFIGRKNPPTSHFGSEGQGFCETKGEQ